MAFEREFQKKCDANLEEVLTLKKDFTELLVVRDYREVYV